MSANPIASLPGLLDARARQQKLHKATQEFEAVFVKLLLTQMRESMTDSAAPGGGQQAKIYQDMMDEAIAAQISKTGRFGLARVLNQKLQPATQEEQVSP